MKTFCIIILFAFVSTIANAQYTKLGDFNGPGLFTGGANPTYDQNVISVGSMLYGMTNQGGTNNMGIIFKMKPDGTGYSNVLDFAGAANGSNPRGSLIFDGTFLYGMTSEGGTSNRGVLFKIKPDGTGYSKLLDFEGVANGMSPYGSLISDGAFLYGMTYRGGTNDRGTIFKIKPDGTGYSKLLDFDGEANGSSPFGSFISDGVFLYGTTVGGGTYNRGVVFKIKPDGTGYSKLLDFDGAANGGSLRGSLISDGAFLYGMTLSGGTNNMGTLFKIKPDGTEFSKLLDFAGSANGSSPFGSLISDGTFLYGMTNQGGTNDMGVVFKIKPDGTGFSKLLDFTGATNGSSPYGSLMSDGAFLYGMTSEGGTNNQGTFFKIKPDGTGYSELLDFAGAANGSNPYGSLMSDGAFLYGMTLFGGTNNMGVLFKIKPDGTGFSKLLDFTGAANGSNPPGSLISDGTFLYGMTEFGGTNNMGTLFKIKSDGTGYTKLLDFDGAANGSRPNGDLISVGAFLYGMTYTGGTNDLGTLFEIKPDGTGFTKLLDFDGWTHGSWPLGSLIYDGSFLYATTFSGGTYDYGTVFKIKPDGTEFTKLVNLGGVAHERYPSGSLIYDGSFLYATTFMGGPYEYGTVFKIKPDGTGYSNLLNFDGLTNGTFLNGSLISNGTFLYGMTLSGGTNDRGTLFKVKPDGTGYSTLLDFAGPANGSNPYGSLITDGTFLYGMTRHGGSADVGTVFKFDLSEMGIAEHNAETDFHISPNPFSSFTILRTDNYWKNASLTVCNLFGQTVKQIDNLTGQTIIFHRDNLPSGLYFIRITQDNKIISANKLVITDN